MGRIAALLICSLIIVTATSACTLGSGGVIRLSQKDAGSTIEMKVGDRLEATLAGNPTTGYQWTVDAVDSAILKQSGEPVFESDSKALGAGGQMTFRFEAVAAGQTTLRLIYHRPFEVGVPPTDTFEVTVVVK